MKEMRKKVEQSQYYFENSGKKSLISVEKGQLLVEKQVEEENTTVDIEEFEAQKMLTVQATIKCEIDQYRMAKPRRTPDQRLLVRQGEANIFCLRVFNPLKNKGYAFTVDIKDELASMQIDSKDKALDWTPQIRLINTDAEIAYWDQAGFFTRYVQQSTDFSIANAMNFCENAGPTNMIIPYGKEYIDVPFIAFTTREGLTHKENDVGLPKMPKSFKELSDQERECQLKFNQIENVSRTATIRIVPLDGDKHQSERMLAMLISKVSTIESQKIRKETIT